MRGENRRLWRIEFCFCVRVARFRSVGGLLVVGRHKSQHCALHGVRSKQSMQMPSAIGWVVRGNLGGAIAQHGHQFKWWGTGGGARSVGCLFRFFNWRVATVPVLLCSRSSGLNTNPGQGGKGGYRMDTVVFYSSQAPPWLSLWDVTFDVTGCSLPLVCPTSYALWRHWLLVGIRGLHLCVRCLKCR